MATFTKKSEYKTGGASYGREGVRASIYAGPANFVGAAPDTIEFDAPNLAAPNAASAQRKQAQADRLAAREDKKAATLKAREDKKAARAEAKQAKADQRAQAKQAKADKKAADKLAAQQAKPQPAAEQPQA